MKVLFITPQYATDESSGGVQVSLQRIEALRAKAKELTVLCIDSKSTHEENNRNGLKILSARSSVRPRTFSNLLHSYLKPLPLSVYRNAVPKLMKLAQLASAERWDLVYIDHWLVWEAAKLIPAQHRVLHLHNAEPALFDRASERLVGPRKLIAQLEAIRAARYLRKLMPKVDELHVLSHADRCILKRYGVSHERTHVFLPSAQPRMDDIATFEARSASALFVGSMNWPPNHEAVEWFCAQIHPLLKNVRTTKVAGADIPPPLAQRLSQYADIELLGFVRDLRPLYDETRCFIAPLLSGSGIKMKTLNALAQGLPVVTTPIGVEGFPEDSEGAIRIASGPREFAREVDRLVSDSEEWNQASRSARRYVGKYFSGVAWKAWCHERP